MLLKFIRKKMLEGFIKDIIKDFPKYKINAMSYFNEHKEELIKKIVIFVRSEILNKIGLLLIVSLLALPVFAEEQAQQEITFEANKATVAIQKQPMQQNSIQRAEIKNNWFCIIIQNNGKILDNTDNK